ncbi:MAG: pyridoxamine 5'-phosphate oxidase family protein [Cyclobacteriaceae bacterium]|nr:pyridoxamine 5'-phosphate oxidase family protein [Cyclobacteriaceae bacterium]
MLGSLNKYQIDNLLRSEVVGRIGCSADGMTYVVPVTYVYDGTAICAHTKEGLKIDLMRKNPTVCFEVDRIKDLANWQSVIAQGTFEELKGKEADEALQSLVNRLHPMTGSETSIPRHGLERPHSPIDPAIILVVFRIKINEATGRYEKR